MIDLLKKLLWIAAGLASGVILTKTKGGRLGEAAKLFNLTGQNTIYFDVERSELFYSEIQLHFALNMGKAIKSVMDGVGAYARLLEDMGAEGDGTAQKAEPGQRGTSYDFGVTVSAALQLLS